VCVQDYGKRMPRGAEFLYGHYLVVLGVVPSEDGAEIVCQDPSIENVEHEPKHPSRSSYATTGGDVPAGKAEESDNIADAGRVIIPSQRFLDCWEDQTEEGK